VTPAETAEAWEHWLTTEGDRPQLGHAEFTELLPGDVTSDARQWIAAARNAGTTPRYGSREWCQLPWSDPRKTASVFCAAEAWRDHCSAARVAGDARKHLEDEDRAAAAYPVCVLGRGRRRRTVGA
jgi:hypothetical protein